MLKYKVFFETQAKIEPIVAVRSILFSACRP